MFRSNKTVSAPLARAVGMALAAAAAPLHAASSLPEFKSEEIVVSGRDGSAENVTTLRTITAEDIRRGGARTLDEAIALLPGVYVRTGADGTPRIEVLGLQIRHVKLLLDGNFEPTLIPVEQISQLRDRLWFSAVGALHVCRPGIRPVSAGARP